MSPVSIELLFKTLNIVMRIGDDHRLDWGLEDRVIYDLSRFSSRWIA